MIKCREKTHLYKNLCLWWFSHFAIHINIYNIFVFVKKMDISSKLANVDVADKRQDKTNMDAADTTETDEPDVDDTEIDAVNGNK